MENTSVPPQRKKRGPIKRGYIHTHVLLPPDLLEWAKQQPLGLSGLMRQLLTAERQKTAASA